MNSTTLRSSLERLQIGMLPDLMNFMPELVLCLAIVLMLFLRLIRPATNLVVGGALLLSVGMLYVQFNLAWPWLVGAGFVVVMLLVLFARNDRLPLGLLAAAAAFIALQIAL